MNTNIQERSFEFGLRIIQIANSLPYSRAGKILANQVLRSGTSAGANVEEAEAAYTKSTFAYRMNVALSEARETHYWLRLMQKGGIMQPDALTDIIDEAEQIKRILGAIARTTRSNLGKK